MAFLNAGPAALPGLIVMQVQDGEAEDAEDCGRPPPAAGPRQLNPRGLAALDPRFRRVVVALNARPGPAQLRSSALMHAAGGRPLELHPALAQSADAVLREGARVELHDDAAGAGATLLVPGLTAAVFVEPR